MSNENDEHTHNVSVQAFLETQEVQEALLNEELYTAKSNASHSFQRLWDKESSRVATIVRERQEGMEVAFKAILVRAQKATKAAASSFSKVSKVREELHAIRVEMRLAVQDSLVLQTFLTSSRRILSDVAVAADRRIGTKLTPLMEQLFPKKHLNTSLVCIVSDVYTALKQAEEALKSNGGSGDAVWQAPSSFERNTTKYWVTDEDLTALLMACAMEAPLLVYGRKGPLTSTATRRDLQRSEGDKLWDSLATRITSIYFDSADMELYKHRLARAEGAQLLRARWYGPTMPRGERVIFLELKTHHERWVAQKSVKERATIQERDMVPFLRPVPWTKADAQDALLRATPKLQGKDLTKATNLLLRMHNLVVRHKLTACVRSVYYRAAFQSAKSNDLRLTLDRTVTLVDERSHQRSDPEQWCLSDKDAPSARSKVVPFNVFEVKLAGDDPMPPALQESLNTGVIQIATKFSKFTTGAAAFNKVATLPYWAAFPAFRSFFGLTGSVRPVSTVPQGNVDADDGYNLMTSSNQEVLVIPPPGVTIMPRTLARVEPKTYFAHERTFVQWISASTLLLSVSGFLLQTGRFNGTAAVIAASSMGLIVYSTHLYFKRLRLLKIRQPTGYFNKFSPRLLSGLIGLAILLILMDSFKAGDVLGFFASQPNEDRRLTLEVMDGRRNLMEDRRPCSIEEVGAQILLEEEPGALVVDPSRESFLTTSGDSIYSIPLTNDARPVVLVSVPGSYLQGLALVDQRVFAVSDGPSHTDLIEMTWWSASSGKEGLRQVGRWKLLDTPSHVNGFTFSPTENSGVSDGVFYLDINSSIHVYSVPQVTTDNPGLERSTPPRRLKGLNTKFLLGSLYGSTPRDGNLSSIFHFEGVFYILVSKRNVIQAWDLTTGEMLGELVIPTADQDEHTTPWEGFVLERRVKGRDDDTANTSTPKVRGSVVTDALSTQVVLYLFSESSSNIGRQVVWTVPLTEPVDALGMKNLAMPFCPRHDED